MNYSTREPIALFEEAVNNICNYNNTAQINIDLKEDSVSDELMNAIASILDASNCSCSDTYPDQFILDTGYFYVVESLREGFVGRRCVPLITLYFHP